MCIVFFQWTEDRFLVCHNRDEFFSRPTQNIHWWNDDNDSHDEVDDESNTKSHADFQIFAPRDKVSGGTWFGFEKTTGRCAFLTNIRELDPTKYDSSRGALIVNYLQSSKNTTALEYLQNEFVDSPQKANSYAGFNLIVFSGHDLAYYSNRTNVLPNDDRGPVALKINTPYGLSNSVLQEPYAKVQKGLGIFQRSLLEEQEHTEPSNNEQQTNETLLQQLETLMLREDYCPGDPLPKTGEPGFPQAIVRDRSRICIPNKNGYGTRTTIRFLLERITCDDDSKQQQHQSDKQQQTNPQQRILRCIEKNWNLETLQWETSMDLHSTISLPF